MFGLSNELKNISHPNAKKEREEFAYFSSRLPFQPRHGSCALDTATAMSSPLRTAAACHSKLPTLNLGTKQTVRVDKRTKILDWDEMKSNASFCCK
ncbi:hypothetical protein GUITHDRAFT_109130 [Guillardia theta CCMP2712]|uniref:Uncharacterized protein n=1 Tax=Guillardia theta (strain CCMP2712) TaxID=905079 RepID=L1JAF1_GUITC|nr:hypothetical protein GUITHDRAFT_109130 [Guillardia theta CCMP2712]EKX45084.1 hypothetical protein GUITHDRAFT_109130 [Guillardia theta CCMP2712]|eukprot:XP_005832064.1 hypothetical protein GUITHDRAFT_109130 [Guillardia theta CCMP2712]